MAVCANCKHHVLVHALNGCRARKRDETCPCLFDYDADTKSFNSKVLPVNPCLLGHVDGCEHVKDPSMGVQGIGAAGTQVGGDHYRQNKVQPWDIVDDWGLDFYRGNALKYLLRAGRKGPAVEDLKKAKHYIEKCI